MLRRLRQGSIVNSDTLQYCDPLTAVSPPQTGASRGPIPGRGYLRCRQPHLLAKRAGPQRISGAATAGAGAGVLGTPVRGAHAEGVGYSMQWSEYHLHCSICMKWCYPPHHHLLLCPDWSSVGEGGIRLEGVIWRGLVACQCCVTAAPTLSPSAPQCDGVCSVLSRWEFCVRQCIGASDSCQSLTICRTATAGTDSLRCGLYAGGPHH